MQVSDKYFGVVGVDTQPRAMMKNNLKKNVELDVTICSKLRLTLCELVKKENLKLNKYRLVETHDQKQTKKT